MALGVVAVSGFIFLFLKSLLHSELSPAASPTLVGGTVNLGKLLFRQYALPFEIVSVLLLVAMVGVVILSKKDLR